MLGGRERPTDRIVFALVIESIRGVVGQRGCVVVVSIMQLGPC